MQYKISFWTTLIFALCLIAFGYVGYHKTGSAMSLYSSLTFGILLLGTCIGMFYGKSWSPYAAIFLTALLTALFIYRTVAATHKLIPAILAIVSLAVFYFLLYTERGSRRQH